MLFCLLPYCCTTRGSLPAGDNVRIRGVVVRNQTACVVDGVCRLEVSTAGGRIDILYGAGWQHCGNPNIADQGVVVKTGEAVEVLGRASGEKSIDACGPEDAYIRRVK
jgi:hypothetical protein